VKLSRAGGEIRRVSQDISGLVKLLHDADGMAAE
jgi:hypothetical protein